MSFKADFYNVFNRHHWAGPNMNSSSKYFGHVTGLDGNYVPRHGQLSARFEW
jgi:hypothetical protein